MNGSKVHAGKNHICHRLGIEISQERGIADDGTIEPGISEALVQLANGDVAGVTVHRNHISVAAIHRRGAHFLLGLVGDSESQADGGSLEYVLTISPTVRRGREHALRVSEKVERKTERVESPVQREGKVAQQRVRHVDL
jgi:hypothetical protein